MVLFDPGSDSQTITRACCVQAQSAVEYEKHVQFILIHSTGRPI